MKIRSGFVSNSSTTSFCIYGVCISGHLDFWELKHDGVISKEPKLYHYGAEDGMYIGNEWSGVGDDETGRQFKERTEKEITELIDMLVEKGVIEKPNLSFCTHDYGAYDG